MAHQSALIETDIHAYLEEHERKEILRFLTCGSVDDGKSTLIGRLLHDSKMIMEDQLDAIKRESKTIGTQRDGVDLALLVDGLQAEREQGITIDVAYRYFSTAKRKFIIADTPGHEQYTRNMVTGASTCDVAIILIDAKHGVLPQTKRHTFLAHLLGIRHLIVAINKMDAVDYQESVYETIRADYLAFTSQLSLDDLTFIPISALVGDNVVDQSTAMPWYQGATLMFLLETVPISTVRDTERVRFPVQWVNRPDSSFRGYCGTLAGGVVAPGDSIRILPSGKTAAIERIVTADGDVDRAFPPMSVTLTLDREVDVSRGDVITSDAALPHTADRFEATVVWMAEAPLELDKRYLIKHGTKRVTGQVTALDHKIDVNTLDHLPASALELNEIGRAVFELSEPIVFDPYADNRAMGALILIDRLSNNTVGAAMIQAPTGVVAEAAWDEAPHGEFRSAVSRVSAAERAERLRQHPATILLTGLSRVGKTVIAQEVERRLFDGGWLASVNDGQEFRLGVSRDLGFSTEERSENARRAAEVSKLMNDAGLITLNAFVVPHQRVRERIRERVGADHFIEIFLTAPIDVLRSRDDDGFYARADSGEIANFPGVSSAFEEPEAPDLTLHTDRRSIAECADAIIALLRERGTIF